MTTDEKPAQLDTTENALLAAVSLAALDSQWAKKVGETKADQMGRDLHEITQRLLTSGPIIPDDEGTHGFGLNQLWALCERVFFTPEAKALIGKYGADPTVVASKMSDALRQALRTPVPDAGHDGAMSPEMMREQQAIRSACDEIKQGMLVQNRQFGNPIFNPAKTFSRATPEERIDVLLDEKLGNLRRSTITPTAIAGYEFSIIAYLILKRAAKILRKNEA